jgi:hypothetical protein
MTIGRMKNFRTNQTKAIGTKMIARSKVGQVKLFEEFP